MFGVVHNRCSLEQLLNRLSNIFLENIMYA